MTNVLGLHETRSTWKIQKQKIHTYDGRTDGRTDRQKRYITIALCIALLCWRKIKITHRPRLLFYNLTERKRHLLQRVVHRWQVQARCICLHCTTCLPVGLPVLCGLSKYTTAGLLLVGTWWCRTWCRNWEWDERQQYSEWYMVDYTRSGQRCHCIFTARSELRKVLFLAPSVCGFLFVYEIYPEFLNGSAPNSQGRRVWSLARLSLQVKVKGKGHQAQKRHFSALPADCMRFMFGKTSLESSFL